MVRRVGAFQAVTAGLCAAIITPAAAFAQDKDPDLAGQVEALRSQLSAQQQQIETQQSQIDELRRALLGTTSLKSARATGAAQNSPTGQSAVASAQSLPDRPVGEAPAGEPLAIEVAAVPQGQGVLTPRGTLVFDPSLEYTRSSNNRLVFRGIELIPGIQIGLIEATDVDRDTFVGTAAFRYGLTNRIEIEARVPFLHRYDRIEVVQNRDEQIVRSIELKENGIGDAEFAARYQFNRPSGQKPIFVGSLRVKSATGKGPYEVGFDEFGVAEGLATGSGFWAVSPGVSFLLPSDPTVIYGGIAYLYHIPRNIDRLINDAFIGRVDPGDAISANIGFGFALNPRFSYSLGYRHDYIFKTRTEIGDTEIRSRDLQAGSLVLGASYRVTARQTLNLGFQFGVTEDAPDMSVTLRMPFTVAKP